MQSRQLQARTNTHNQCWSVCWHVSGLLCATDVLFSACFLASSINSDRSWRTRQLFNEKTRQQYGTCIHLVNRVHLSVYLSRGCQICARKRNTLNSGTRSTAFDRKKTHPHPPLCLLAHAAVSPGSAPQIPCFTAAPAERYRVACCGVALGSIPRNRRKHVGRHRRTGHVPAVPQRQRHAAGNGARVAGGQAQGRRRRGPLARARQGATASCHVLAAARRDGRRKG